MLYGHYARSHVASDNPLVKSGHYGDIRAFGGVLSDHIRSWWDTWGVVAVPEQPSGGVWCLYWPDYILPRNTEAVSHALKMLGHAHPDHLYGDADLGLLVFPDHKQLQHYLETGNIPTSPLPWAVTEHVWDLRPRSALIAYTSQKLHARHFNAVAGDAFILHKTSTQTAKIKAEYDYYYLLPDFLKRWFVQPFHWRIDGDKASYQMERLHIPDLAAQVLNDSLSPHDMRQVLSKLKQYVTERPAQTVEPAFFKNKIQTLYVDKVQKRLEELKALPLYPWLSHALSLTPYQSLDHLWDMYQAAYHRLGKRKAIPLAAIHGDLCFSNILYDPATEVLRLIDPRGASDAADLYDDPWYDLAKLSHALMGQYDFLNQGYYEIQMGADNLLSLKILGQRPNFYTDLFAIWLEAQQVPLSTIRLYEASLFLSMLPLHSGKPRNVLAFAMQAGFILETLS